MKWDSGERMELDFSAIPLPAEIQLDLMVRARMRRWAVKMALATLPMAAGLAAVWVYWQLN